MTMLPIYVQGWKESGDAVLALADGLTPAQWATPTDLPGWTVQDVVAHLGHLEAVLSGLIPDVASDARGEVISDYTESGVAERRGRAAQEITEELRRAFALRVDQVANAAELDPAAVAAKTPGDIGWTWDTLLRNRCIDMWCHEQDIRRAVGVPGGFDGTAAQVVTTAFSFAMPFVLGKQVRPPAGTTVRWNVTGPVPVDLTARIGDDGRASTVEGDIDGDVTELQMSTETFAILAGGRRGPADVDVTIVGDQELGQKVLSAMGITP